MKLSRFLVKTLREVPSGAEISSHIFLLRGGYVKQMASGLYSVLPLGRRVLEKITRIVREEMNGIKGQEIELPVAQPAELWMESGRYGVIGAELLRFKDRADHYMVLAMTHEEAVTDLARSVLSSYKQLPFMVYQFQLKFRDEPRPRGGLIRVREFTMKDAYSFHADEGDLDRYYQEAYAAYERIFSRVGIRPVIVKSDTGIMGGKVAHEFMLESPHGEDYLIIARDGSYSQNQEIAEFHRESKPEPQQSLEKIPTPGHKTIEEVAAYLGVEARHTMKAVMLEINRDGKRHLVMVMVRGDLEASEIKVKNYLKTNWCQPAPEEFIRSMGIVPGYASPIGLSERADLHILVDISIAEANNFIAGANEDGFHYRGSNFRRDFKSPHAGDFAKAMGGHKAPDGNTELHAIRGIEIGNIFKLGNKFTQSMDCTFLDEAGQKRFPIMGCYGIGIGRLMAAVIENSHDDFGPLWPKEITPFHVQLVSIGKESEIQGACSDLEKQLEQSGFDTLFDDRDERPGVKFKDADLWGIPLRVSVSKKSLAEGAVEWKIRGEKEHTLIPIASVLDRVRAHYS